MKKFIKLLALFIATMSCYEANAQNSLCGFVFKDFNYNKQKGNTATFNKPLVTGISERTYNTIKIN